LTHFISGKIFDDNYPIFLDKIQEIKYPASKNIPSKQLFIRKPRRESNMNKLELIDALRSETKISKPEAAKIVDLFFNEISEALAKEDRVEIRGLCSFFVKKYGSYTGRNPKTGEKVTIAPKKLPFFKCGKELKERVDHQ